MKRILSIVIAMSVVLSAAVAWSEVQRPGTHRAKVYGAEVQLHKTAILAAEVPTLFYRPWGYWAARGGFSNDPKDYSVTVDMASQEGNLVDVYIRGQVPSDVHNVAMLIRTIQPDDTPIVPQDLAGCPSDAPECLTGWRTLAADSTCEVTGSEFVCTHKNVPSIFLEGDYFGNRVEVLFFQTSSASQDTYDILVPGGPGGDTWARFIMEPMLTNILQGTHSPSLLSGTIPAFLMVKFHKAFFSPELKNMIKGNSKNVKDATIVR